MTSVLSAENKLRRNLDNRGVGWYNVLGDSLLSRKEKDAWRIGVVAEHRMPFLKRIRDPFFCCGFFYTKMKNGRT